MSRIPYSDPAALSAETREMLARLPPFNIFRMLARTEEVFRTFIRFNNAVLNKSVLDPVLREVAIIRAGHRAGASYEVVQHERVGRSLGMDEALLRSLDPAADGAVWPERIAAIVAAADELAVAASPTEETLARLRAFLSDRELIELVFAISCYMMVSRLLVTTGVELEDGDGAPLPVRGARVP